MPADETQDPQNRVPAEGSVTLQFPSGGGDLGAGESTPADKFFARTTAQASVDAGRAYLMQHPEEIPAAGPGQGGIPTAEEEALQKPAGTKAQEFALGLPGSAVEAGATAVGASPETAKTAGNITNLAVGAYGVAKAGIAAVKAAPTVLDAIKGFVGLGGEGGAAEGATAGAGAEGAEGTAPLDITGGSGKELPKTSEHFQTLLDHPQAAPELKAAVNNLQPAIRDPDTGQVYLADDPKAKNHYQVFGDLPADVANKSKLDSGFVGAEGEYMTRQQAADHLIAAQATGTAPTSPDATISGEKYPVAGEQVSGLEVGKGPVANASSISASLGDEYETLKGIREVPMSEFNTKPRDLFYAADDIDHAEALAQRIKQTGRIDPAIVVMDKDGPYILEGAHRIAALNILGKDSFPALVVNDTSENMGIGAAVAPKESGGITGMARGSISTKPIQEPVALTPEDAVNSLAQKQAVALKNLRVGKTVAERIGRPDISTTVPEAETMAAGAAQQMTPDEVAAQVDKLPISQRVAAWTTTIDNEAQDMRATARDLVQRAANGENVDAELSDLNNRYGAFARGGSAVQMAQGTEVARGLEIMNPLKPTNLSIAAAARIAQQLPEDYSPMMLAEMLAKQTPTQILKSAVMADRVAGKGASVGQMLYSLYRFGMLADLKTPARILLSNAATSLMEVPPRMIAPYLGDAGEIGNREWLDMVTAVPEGAKTGLRMWAKSVTEGGNAQDMRVMEQLAGTDYARSGANSGYLSGASPLSSQGTSLEGTTLGAGLDHLGDYMETGMGALVTGPHQFGKSMAQEMQLNALAKPIARAQAISEGLTGADASKRIAQLMPIIKARPDLFAASADWSDFATFTRASEGQGIVNSLANSQNPFARGVGTIGQWLFPFRSISNQMIRYGAGWIPLPITRENWMGFTGVGRDAALSRARMGLGTLLGSAVAYESLKGNVTGDGPQSKQARLMSTEQGIAPNSVRLPNGTYVGMPEPFRQPMSLIANAIEAAPYLKQAMDDGHPILDEMGNKVTPELALYMAALGTARSFTDMPTMETASHIFDLVDGVSSNKDFAAKLSQFTSQLAGGALPLSTLSRQASNANDPSLREVDTWMTGIRNRIYPLSKEGAPTRDWRGKPVVGQPGVFANMISPINVTKEHLDPADQLLQQNGVVPPAVPYYIGGSPSMVPDPNAPAPVPLDGRARDQWAKFRGGYDERDDSSMLEDEVLSLGNAPSFAAMPRAGKNIELTHIVTRASVLATAQLIGWAQKNDPKLFAQIIQHKMAKAVAMSPTAIPEAATEPEEAGATP